MKAVRDHVFDAGDRQNYTYGALVRDLGIKRDFNRLPLTELQFNLEKVDELLDMAGVATHFTPNAKAYSNFDLFLNVIESAEGLRLDCDFNTDVYDESTVAALARLLRNLACGDRPRCQKRRLRHCLC